MKKSIVSLLFIAALANVSAQTSVVCTDIQVNLSRGSESKTVLALQNFLYAKGFLKASPNGYFGAATLASVKAYQKSVGLSQVGNTGPGTRALIKKDSCSSQLPSSTQSAGATPPQIVATSSTTPPSVSYKRPQLNSLEKGTLFARGSTTWNVILWGSSLSTSSNTVYFKNISTGKKYTISAFGATASSSIMLPNDITTRAFPCGAGCIEALPAGNYNVSVENSGGESDTLYTSIQSFSASASTGSEYIAVRQNATSTLLGTISFSASVPFYLSNFDVNIETEGLSGGTGVSNLTFKDQVTGSSIFTGIDAGAVSAHQSKIIGVYGNVDSQRPGSIYGSATVTIVDYVGGKPITFTTPRFMTSVSGF